MNNPAVMTWVGETAVSPTPPTLFDANDVHFRTLVEISAEGIVIINPEGHFLYVSPAYERLLGYASEDLLGKPFQPLIHPDDFPQVMQAFAAFFTNPDLSTTVDYRTRHKNGNWHVAESVGKLLPDGNVVVYSRDVTERKQLEAKLRAGEEYFRSLIENASDSIAVTDQKGNFIYISPAYERIWGWTADELLGQPFLPLIHPDDVTVAGENIVKLLTVPGYIGSTQIRVQHKDGSWRVIEGKGKLLPDGNIVSNTRDVTERRQAEEALHRAELRFRAVFEQPLLAVRIYGADGRLIAWNKATLDLFHMTDEQMSLLSQNYNVLTDADAQRLSYLADIHRAFAGEAVSFPPLQRILPNGKRAWLQAYMYPVRDAAGAVSEVVSISQDVTAQREAAEKLQHLNEELERRVEERTAESKRLAAIIEATPDYVGIADLQGRSLYINKAGKEMVGLPPDEDKAGLSVIGCYPEREHGRAMEMVEATLQAGVWSGEMTLLHQNGREIPVSEVTFTLPDAEGNIEALGTIMRDITIQKQVEGELKAAKETAEAANKAKSTFLANMSHEIRTPMNAVIGMTSLLLNTPLNEKQQDFVETIRTSGDALLTIINDILDFSKIEAGKMDLESQLFDLRSCIESALDLLAPKALEKGVELAYEMDVNVPGAIIGDVTRLRQILVNLVSNAIKFTKDGEVVVTVSRGAGEQENGGVGGQGSRGELFSPLPRRPSASLHFSVRDTGIGIVAEKIDKLFQSFSQLDSSTTREYGGTGLGLAISRRLVELMGGRMWAESGGTGKGATFYFTIMAEAAAAPVRVHLHSRQPLLAGKRLLIVDDNLTNRRILNLQAQTWGMEAVEMESPTAVLQLLRQGERFDLAVLDMHMPEMDGVELAVAMCAAHEEQNHHFPLVMLTSLGYETRPELEELQCFSAYLTKPVKPSQLYDVFVSVLVDEERENQRVQTGILPAINNKQLLTEKLPLRLLLAEDVAVNQKFALLALAEMGYQADVAANGLEVLAALQRQPYDVILMDVQMPELDGLEATRRIRRDFPAERQPRIVAMTANAMQGDRELCLQAGMDDYVSKPVYLEELQAALLRAGKERRSGGAEEQRSRGEVVDEKVLAGILGRKSGRQLINLYLTEAAGLVTAVQQAISQQDAHALKAAAHSLKGSSRYMGAQQVVRLSGELETVGRQGNVGQAAVLGEQLLVAFGQVREILQDRDLESGD